MNGRLRDALNLTGGIVCAVGAGGKKSLLAALAREHRPDDGRLALTHSARSAVPEPDLVEVHLIADEARLDAALVGCSAERVAYSGPLFKPGRCEGVTPALIAELHRRHRFALTLVKADGARMRWIKAPAEDEPALVPGCTLVLPVLSLRALGQALDDRVAHRPERVAALTGRALGEALAEADYATLMSHADGCLRGCSGLRVVPVLNMCDDGRLDAARRIAERALARTSAFERVLMTDLRDPAAPVYEVMA